MAFFSWQELGWPLKLTVLSGFLAGFGGILATIALQYQPVDHSAAATSLIFLICSFISLTGALSLLRVPMTATTSGILGIVVFVVSVFLLYADVLVALSGFPPKNAPRHV